MNGSLRIKRVEDQAAEAREKVAEGQVVEDRAPGGVAEAPVVEDRFCLSCSRLAEGQAVEVPREGADNRPGAAEVQVAEDHAKVEAQGVEAQRMPAGMTPMVFA